MNPNQLPNEPVPLSEALQEVGAVIFDRPEFRDVIDRALEDHKNLLQKEKSGQALSNEEEQRFTQVSEFIKLGSEIIRDYQRP